MLFYEINSFFFLKKKYTDDINKMIRQNEIGRTVPFVTGTNANAMTKYYQADQMNNMNLGGEEYRGTYTTVKEDAEALKIPTGEIIYSAQLANNGIAIVCCMISIYDMADYVHNKFPQAGGFYYETPWKMPAPGAPIAYKPKPTESLDDSNKIFIKATQPDEIANLIIKDVNIIKYDYPTRVTDYQEKHMRALGLKKGPVYIDNPLNVTEMIRGGHILVIDNTIYVIKPTKSGHAFIFANAEMAQFIFDKVSKL